MTLASNLLQFFSEFSKIEINDKLVQNNLTKLSQQEQKHFSLHRQKLNLNSKKHGKKFFFNYLL